ncbi:Uncharacterised protein [Klebsiella pneumoniae]|nr:Uncharacterised protein [Klebsiella pneumoniae]
MIIVNLYIFEPNLTVIVLNMIYEVIDLTSIKIKYR